VLSQWTKPFLTAFGNDDKIFKGLDRFLQKVIPGAQGQPHTVLENAGHFIQEDKGEDLARIVVDFVEKTKI
jgi:haloalkane dehalogenase